MAKQKSGGGFNPKIGQGHDFKAVFHASMGQIRRQMRKSYEVLHEYAWAGDSCPCCLKSVSILGNVSQNHHTLHVSGWYCNEEKLLIFYWLCHGCSFKLRYGSSEQQFELSQQVEKNTLAAWWQNRAKDL